MEPPEKPSDSDCCSSGCTPCVFDVYEKLLKQWEIGANNTPASKDHRHDLLSTLKYKPYTLLRVDRVNVTTNIYVFQPHTDTIIDGVLPYAPGQHLITIADHSQTISRSYTPVSLAEDSENCVVRFLIKLYEHGQMSSIISKLNVGDVMHFRGAFGDFKHVPNSKYIMLCAGTGFAPMYTVIKAILRDDRDETIIRLNFTCAVLSDIYFRGEIREFSKFWNFLANVYVTQARSSADDQVKADENIHLAQRISAEVVRRELVGRESFKVLVCGSDAFNKDICDYVEACGIGKNNIFVF